MKSKSQHFTIKLNYSSPIFCQNCDMRLNDTYFDFSFHGYKIKEKPIKTDSEYLCITYKLIKEPFAG